MTNTNTKVLLWLDDVRDPSTRTWVKDFAPDFVNEGTIVWVKDFDQFNSWVTENGLPSKIAFDHDLGLGKSGYDAAKLVVEYCLDNGVSIPAWTIQSSNTVGRDNIDGLFKSFLRSVG